MQKTDLVNLVKKYYLDGVTFQENSSGFNPVLFLIQNKNCEVKLKSSDKSLMILLDYNFDLEDCDLVIPESKNLLSYLSAFSDEISLVPEKSGIEYSSLKISDDNINGNVALGSLDVVDKDINFNLPNNFDVDIILSKEEIDLFLKSKKGLPDAKLVAFLCENDKIDVVINYNVHSHNVDSITTKFSNFSGTGIEPMAFKIDVLSSIFQNNSDFREGKIRLLQQGLMVVQFSGEDYTVKYLLKPIEIV